MEILKFIESVSSGKKDYIFFELGFCDAMHTKLIHEILSRQTHSFGYHAFEMVSANYQIGVSEAGFLPNLTLYNLAISDKSEKNKEYFFSNNPGFYGSSSLRTPKETLNIWPELTFERKHYCDTTSIDDCCMERNIGYIDFIWADLQGAEVDMINGSKEMLKKTEYIYTEYFKDLHEGSIGLNEMLEMLPDFEVIHDFGSDVLLKNKLYAR